MSQSADQPDAAAAQDNGERFSRRPLSYLLIVILAIAATYVYGLRVRGIFACPAVYGPDDYLADCNATGYGDYDHGAFWYGLEPQARQHAARASVLFLGDSRMQFGLSAPATSAWFAERGASYYLLGFSHTENLAFYRPLLSRLEPQARVYVINVDHFFKQNETPPVAELLHDDTAPSRYRRKRFWQGPHKALCTALSALCGSHPAIFRDRVHGTWHFEGAEAGTPSGVADALPRDRDKWPGYERLAREFIAALPARRRCVLLTLVPTRSTRRAEARAIADAVGLDLLAPQPEGLHTFDGSHLDRSSAARWSRSFFELAGQRLSACLREPTSATGARRDGVPSSAPRAVP